MSKEKCKGLTKKGNPCQAWAMDGSDYCPAHQLKPEKRRGPKTAMVQPPAVNPHSEPGAGPEPPFGAEGKPAFAHPSRLRCNKPDKKFPGFLQKTCNTLMKPVQTKEHGRIKYWQCPACKNGRKTIGKAV